MRAVMLAAAALLAACTADLGPPGEWTPWDQVEERFRPELVEPPSPAAPSATLRIVSFNVERASDPDLLVRGIQADAEISQADVLLVQEIDAYPEEDGSRAARVAAALGVGYVYAPARRQDDGTHGLAIFSRHRLDNVRVMALPFADLSFRSVRRVALAADVATPNGPVHLINVHLDTRLNVTERILQLRPAVLDAADPVVVAGDFNTNPYVWADGSIPLLPTDAIVDTDQGPVLDDYMRALAFDTPTAGVGATQHIAGFELRLDAIYTRGLELGEPHVERDVNVSDHWPLWLDVTVAAGTP